MGTTPPSSSTTLYNYSSDLTGGSYPGGLPLMRRGTSCRTSYSAADTSNPANNNKWNVHAWATNTFTSAFNLKGRVTLSFFTTDRRRDVRTRLPLRDADRPPGLQRPALRPRPGDRATYDVSNWPSDVRRLTFTFNLSQQETIAIRPPPGAGPERAQRVRPGSGLPLRPLDLPVAARGRDHHSPAADPTAPHSAPPSAASRFRSRWESCSWWPAWPPWPPVPRSTPNHSSYRDSNFKRAIQAANAGIEAALPAQPACSRRRANASSGLLRGPADAPQTHRGSGWCPTQTEDLGGNASYTFQVSSPRPRLQLERPGRHGARRSCPPGRSTASARRVLVRVTAPGGTPLFPKGYAVVSLNSVSYGNSGDDQRQAGLQRQHHAQEHRQGERRRAPRAREDGHAAEQAHRSPGRRPLPRSRSRSRRSTSAGRADDQQQRPDRDPRPVDHPADISWNPTTRVLT